MLATKLREGGKISVHIYYDITKIPTYMSYGTIDERKMIK